MTVPSVQDDQDEKCSRVEKPSSEECDNSEVSANIENQSAAKNSNEAVSNNCDQISTNSNQLEDKCEPCEQANGVVNGVNGKEVVGDVDGVEDGLLEEAGCFLCGKKQGYM